MTDGGGAESEHPPEGEPERRLAGSSGDDVSAGTSVSGVGGEVLRTESEEAGLPPVAEGGARLGWGRDVAEMGQEPAAGNDGTGQSEKDPAGERPEPRGEGQLPDGQLRGEDSPG